ncbi:MAG: vWA domain-containing protein, partial [Nannocystaceae bacterium]
GPDATDLYGGTPVSAGLTVVLDHLAAIADGRPQAVVLVTDGAANCMAGTSGSQVFTEYDDDLAPMVAQAYADGVPTYVVGVDILDEVGVYPQANPYQRLDELAVAGGVPQLGGGEAFYNTTDEQTLFTALDGIAAELSCTIELDQPAEFTDQITVRIDGQTVPRVDECGPDGVGWRYLQDAAPYTSLELCAATCDEAHAVEQLGLDYACIPPG